MSNKTAKCNDQPASERSCPDPTGSLQNVNIGDTFWLFTGQIAPQIVEIVKKFDGGILAYKVRDLCGREEATTHFYLFDDPEELQLAVEAHAYFLARWARDFHSANKAIDNTLDN